MQETLHFDPRSEAITSLRSKEEAHDYRYFPEPDLTPVAISDEMLARARGRCTPSCPPRGERFERGSASAPTAHGCWPGAASWATTSRPRPLRATAAAAAAGQLAQRARGRIDEEDPAASRAPRGAGDAGRDGGRQEVTATAGRTVLDRLVAQGGDPRAVVEAEGLGAVGASDELEPLAAALDANPDVADKLRGGNLKPMGVIVGHVMRETRGRADAGEVTRMVRERLGV